MLQIKLFGTPAITEDGLPLAITRRKSRALLYFLATHPKPVARERLMAFFWPDAERTGAQQTLRSTLYGMRKTLGGNLLVENEQVGLAEDVQVDAREFEASASLGATAEMLTRAIALYQGDFLSDFTLPDLPEYDDWMAAERERYRRLMVRALLAVSRAQEDAQAYPAALDALERALAFDPLQEDVQRAALRLHYYAGDRAGAIRRYEQFQHLLEDEMGVPPMPETRSLYDAIITDRLPNPKKVAPPQVTRTTLAAPAPRAEPDRLPFTGRAQELDAVRGLMAAHRVAWLEGEAGIGKSRLLEELSATTPLAMIGRARELEGAVPYQPVIEALRTVTTQPGWSGMRDRLSLQHVWLDEVAHLLPELSRESSGARVVLPPVAVNDESRLWEGLFQFLLALGRERPVLFALDDAHWADGSSLALSGYLARRAAVARAPLALVIAARPVDAGAPLASLQQSLVRDGIADVVRLRRLSPDETRLLAQQLSSAYAEPLADWLLRISEGNPYVVSELVRDARARGILRTDGTLNLSALADAPTLPRGVQGLIEPRLARLSDNARRVLDVGVAAGREFEFAVVRQAAGLSEDAVLDALDELRAARIIDDVRRDSGSPPAYAFDHTLTMEVAYRMAGEARHRLMHARVAEALEHSHRARLDQVAGLVAFHYTEGMLPERAAPFALRAGQLAARLPAWKEAVAFFELAARGEQDTGALHQIYMALGDAREQEGLVAQAADAFREALRLAQAPVAADMARLRLARVLMTLGRYAETVALAEETVSGGRPECLALAEFTWGTALSVEGRDLEGAMVHLQSSAALSQSDPTATARVLFEMGGVVAQLGDLERAVSLYRDSLAAAERAGAGDTVPAFWRILANNNLGYHLHLLGDAQAQSYAEAGLRLAQEHGQLTLQTYLLSTLGEIALAAGDIAGAEARFREGLALAEQFAVPERQAGLTANLGRVAIAQGQTALAVHRLSSALARAEGLGIRHLTAQIHLWLAPLLPASQAHEHLGAARAIADTGHRQRLQADADRLAASLPPEPS